MKFKQTKLKGVFLIEPTPHGDDRGLFCRLHCKREFADAGIDFDPVQMNLSTNQHAYTMRGMHYKPEPYAEPKVVRAIQGEVLDVAVDVRPESATYLQHIAVKLSSRNMLALYLPEGIAHGFMTLSKDSHILYQMGRYYEPGNEAGLRWDDPALGIEWPNSPAVINERDANYALLETG